MLLPYLQLVEHIIRLREELDREREERSYFQLERDKLHAVWEICKRKQEEIEAELRNSTWKNKEAEERHRVEINVYKQKLKHVLSEQHNAVFEVKADAISSSLLLQNQGSKSELEVLNLQAESREKKFEEHNSIKQLKLIETRSFKRMRSLIETEEKKRRSAILDMEEQMRSRVESLREEHDRALGKGEQYFSQILQKQQEDLNKWKEEVKKLQKEKAKHKKDLTACQQEKEVKVEKELLLQAFEKVNRLYPAALPLSSVAHRELTLPGVFLQLQQERDELLETHKESILGVQQRSGLKKQLVQRKLAALTETLEKEAQLRVSAKQSDSDSSCSGCDSISPLQVLNSSCRSRERLMRTEPLAGRIQEVPESRPAASVSSSLVLSSVLSFLQLVPWLLDSKTPFLKNGENSQMSNLERR
uniref:Dynein regulatory complex subunit 4 n=1 Tax=Cyprinodon variegatus TaxID=28743 RepID=A0A3Q2CM00_CYPVA